MNRELKLSVIQCFLLLLFLLVGWELLIIVYTPMGDNWMWGQYMIIYCIGVCVLVAVSNIIGSSFSEKMKKGVSVFQILTVMTYLIFNISYRPYRALFMAIASVSAIILGIYLMNYLATKHE